MRHLDFPPSLRVASCEVWAPQRGSLWGQDWGFRLPFLMSLDGRTNGGLDRSKSKPPGDGRMLINSLLKARYNGACGV